MTGSELGLIPVTIPELLRQLGGAVIPEPRSDKARRDARALWRHRQYQAQQAHQRWNAYADALPQPTDYNRRYATNQRAALVGHRVS